MPHLVTHRARYSNLGSSDLQADSHALWETFNALGYLVGGLTFVAGSCFFFPVLSAYLAIGDWLFFCGSILYLLVTGHDLLEVLKYWRRHGTNSFADRIEFIAAWSYVIGSALFSVGSVCFLPSVEAVAIGGWCFIIGSVLFVIGGFVNILQIVDAPSMLYMQLFNCTVAQFILGSGLFATASIPYLWHLGGAAQKQVTMLDASLFLFASVLFFLGGLCIYYRKLVRHELVARYHAGRLGAMFISALRQEEQQAQAGER